MEFADWTRAFLMMGDSPVGVREVLLAEDGSMYALLQGMTPDDELRTVRLDDEGRMSAFIIDSTDAWAQMLTIGNAELAARLTNAFTYDRRGNMVLRHNFSEGFGLWEAGGSGVDWTVELSPLYHRTGGYSMKLSTGSTTGNTANIHGNLAILPTATVGLAALVSFDTPPGELHWYIDYRTGARRYEVQFKYDNAANALLVDDGTPAWHTAVDNLKVYEDAAHFHFIKLVIDADEGEYVRLLFDKQVADLRGYEIPNFADVGASRLYMKIELITDTDAHDIAYIDDVIVTVAET